MKRMPRVIAASLVILLFAVLGCCEELVWLDLPRLNPADDFTYVVCPSAVLDEEGHFWLAATVGRLVPPHWSEGYEQVRLYKFSDHHVEGWVVDDVVLDGDRAEFEYCQNSLAWIDGKPVIAATASYAREGEDVADRYSFVSLWVRHTMWAWRRYVGATHWWVPSHGYPSWAHRWLGDPVILPDPNLDTFQLFYFERTATDEWCQWMVKGFPPALTVASSTIETPVSVEGSAVYLADVAWAAGNTPLKRAVGLVSDHDSNGPNAGPPWPVVKNAIGVGSLEWVPEGGYVGPDGVWGRNPALIRWPNGNLATWTIVFESTPDLRSPGEVSDGQPVEYSLYLWGESMDMLPRTVLSPPAYVSNHEPRRIHTGLTLLEER